MPTLSVRASSAVMLLTGSLAALSVAACAVPERGPTASFRARTVRILVGVSPGGGQDLYARVLAPFLGRHLPGQPSVIVDNMPGAGGLVATNYLAFQARGDGATLGLLTMQAPLAQLMADRGARFDVRRFGIVGSPSNDVPVCIASKSSRVDLSAWRAGRIRPRLGATNYGSSTHVSAALIAAALDLPYHPVIGYKGTSDIRVAMESGEVDGTCASIDTYIASFEPKKDFVLLLYAGAGDAPGLEGVPSATTLVTDARGRQLVEVLATLDVLTRFFALPSGTPAEILEVVRRAFAAALNDGAFVTGGGFGEPSRPSGHCRGC